MSRFSIRQAVDADRIVIARLLRERWGGESVVVRDTEFLPGELATFLATDRHQNVVGFAAYDTRHEEYEVIVLDSLIERQGIGSALLAQVEREACANGRQRVSLMTTNDNIGALRFYLLRGYRITSVSLGAVDRARAIKPAIPLVAGNGIPISDELTLVKMLACADDALTGG